MITIAAGKSSIISYSFLNIPLSLYQKVYNVLLDKY